MIPLSRIADFRHLDAPISADSRATQAATSLCVTAASVTRPHVGQIQVFRIDRYDSHVVAFREGAFAVNHCRDQSPTVTRARAGSVHSPRAIANDTPASHRSASTRRSKVLERSRPSGPRYLARHRPFARFSTKPLMSLPDWPVVGARLDPGLDLRPPVSHMPPDPVTSRPFSAVTPPIERGYRYAEQVGDLSHRHEPVGALDRAEPRFWPSSHLLRCLTLVPGRD